MVHSVTGVSSSIVILDSIYLTERIMGDQEGWRVKSENASKATEDGDGNSIEALTAISFLGVVDSSSLVLSM